MDLDDLLTIPRNSVVEVGYTSEGKDFLDLFYFIVVTGDGTVMMARNKINSSYNRKVEFLPQEISYLKVLGSSGYD